MKKPGQCLVPGWNFDVAAGSGDGTVWAAIIDRDRHCPVRERHQRHQAPENGTEREMEWIIRVCVYLCVEEYTIVGVGLPVCFLWGVLKSWCLADPPCGGPWLGERASSGPCAASGRATGRRANSPCGLRQCSPCSWPPDQRQADAKTHTQPRAATRLYVQACLQQGKVAVLYGWLLCCGQ